jgi:DNA-binding response OmpR family regulator
MLTKDKILIVDDEVEAVDPLMRSFELEGYEVHYAPDGVDALEMVKENAFNLILLDIMMPKLNGYQTLKKLQENDLTAHVPVIFVTGHFSPEEIVQGLESGAVDAISKPFRIAEVLTRSKIRIAESKLKRRYTPVAHFFNEAQEKEHSRRSGLFEFYDRTRAKLGEIYVEDGKVVYATSKDAIKEDAFLQLASTRDSMYIYQDDVTAPNKTLSANITSLILEASKIIDELEAKEIRDKEQKRVLIIDRDRIPRILASRSLKAGGFATMVTSPSEITQETVEKFDPDALVVEHLDTDAVFSRIRLANDARRKVPLIVYCDADHLHEAQGREEIASTRISALVPKSDIDEHLCRTVQNVLAQR